MFKKTIKKTSTIVIITEDFKILSDLHDALYGITGVRVEQICTTTTNVKTVTFRDEKDIVTLASNLAQKDLSLRSRSGNTIMFTVSRNEAA